MCARQNDSIPLHNQALGSERDYDIFTSWVNGATQASIARRVGISANRVHQIVGRFNRHYDSGVGSAFYAFINRTQMARPMLYRVQLPGKNGSAFLCSVVVTGEDFLYDTNFCRNFAASFTSHDLPWAVRRQQPARVTIGYLNSILEEV